MAYYCYAHITQFCCAFGHCRIRYVERDGVWLMIGFRNLADSEDIFLSGYSDHT